ncbi:MAG: hypothetical protein K2Q22_01220 [Cytophagales bacterium]|nr:hypothetical protein [Cytophagales bacterium]
MVVVAVWKGEDGKWMGIWYAEKYAQSLGVALRPVACILIRYSNSPHVTRGFGSCIADLETTHNYVITPTADTYTKGNFVICGLKDFEF